MYRAILTPTATTLTIELPKELVGKSVEVIAFEVTENEETALKPTVLVDGKRKRTFEEAVQFWDANAVDFGKFEQWKRDDLYE
jgi:hypothetical protein